jgi:hypothetical protein
MGKKKRRIELSPEWRKGSERTRKLLAERLEFHRKRREQLRSEPEKRD